MKNFSQTGVSIQMDLMDKTLCYYCNIPFVVLQLPSLTLLKLMVAPHTGSILPNVSVEEILFLCIFLLYMDVLIQKLVFGSAKPKPGLGFKIYPRPGFRNPLLSVC